jgi:hopene-associated glycosyltransferase HpnB
VPFVAIILAALSLCIWIVLTFFRGSFWLLDPFDDDVVRHEPPSSWPRVIAVIPARNEAETIAQTIQSLTAQDYRGELRMVVVDDHSEDDTSAMARKAAKFGGSTDQVEVLSAAPLQAGWTGKLWALQQGVERGARYAPDYFWFTDADIAHAPDTLSRLVSRAETRRLDLTSLMVLLQAKSLPERLLIPPFLFFFLKLYPPKCIASSSSKVAGAAGGCVLLRSPVLARIGGIAAIRQAVIDDCALARAVKAGGGSMWMGLTRKSVSLRSYKTFSEIRDLIARTAFTQLDYSSALLLATVVGMLLTYAVPVILAFHSQALVWRPSLAAWALMTISYLPTIRFYRLSPLWAPFLPVAAAFYSYATMLSAVRFWLGRGGRWKGRSQAPVTNETASR